MDLNVPNNLISVNLNQFSDHGLINDNKIGKTVSPSDIEGICKSIDNIFKDKKCLVQMSENGKKAFKNKYNWQFEEKKLLSLYERLI